MSVAGFVRGGLRITFIVLALTATLRPATATDFAVNSAADDGSAGTMRWAIEQLNAAGAGNHSITFDDGVNGVPLTDSLPHIDATGMTVVINGFGCTLDGDDQHRLIFVAAGNVTLLNFNLENGLAAGGDGGDGNSGGGGGGGLGGALFVNNGASVTLNNVNFDSNSANGGDGGNAGAGFGGGGGGGGGLGGDGGDVSSFGGGGGGGFLGDGGNSSTFGGAGGGGVLGDGGGTLGTGGGGGGGLILPGGPSVGFVGGIGALTGGDGGDGFIGENGGNGIIGGGGGGGYGDFTTGGLGGAGGTFGGGGGGGHSLTGPGDGGDGGAFGGGGGAGGGPGSSSSGNGGFGGGGAGASANGAAGTAGFGGGAGGTSSASGDGGDGYGGAVFVRQGGTLTIINSAITDNTVAAGSGDTNGSAAGAGMYLHTGVTAAVQITGSQSYTYANTIAGNGGLNKTGNGTLTMSANNTYTGSTTVSAGTLVLDGTNTSDTTINSGATLQGTGSTTGELDHQGTFAPGNSIGTFTAAAYTSHSGSVFEVEINDGGVFPGTNSDLLQVTDGGNGGVATINGGTVDVKAAAGNYVAGTTYVFLIGDSVTGQFDSITDDLAFLDAVLGYSNTNVHFTLVGSGNNYADLACTPNTYHVGVYLDGIAPTATGDLETLLQALDQVSNDEACYALEQLDGAIYGSTSQIGVQNTTIYIQTLANRLRAGLSDGDSTLAAVESTTPDVVMVSYTSTKDEPLLIHDTCSRCNRWNTWATGFGLGGNARTDGNAAGLNYSTGGTLAGLEAADSCNLVGFFGGYLYNYIGTNANDSNQINGGTVGSYYLTRYDNHYTLGVGGFEFDGFDSRRRISFADETAEGNTDGWKGYYYAENGVTYGNRRLSLQPFGGLQYIYVRQNGFTETGAAAANLAVPGINTHSLRGVLGSRLFAESARRGGRYFSPEVRTLWLHEFLDTETGFNTYFSEVGAGGGSFAINGLGMGRDWAVLGTGVNCDLGCNWSTYGNYDLMLNDQTTFHIGSGGVQYLW